MKGALWKCSVRHKRSQMFSAARAHVRKKPNGRTPTKNFLRRRREGCNLRRARMGTGNTHRGTARVPLLRVVSCDFVEKLSRPLRRRKSRLRISSATPQRERNALAENTATTS